MSTRNIHVNTASYTLLVAGKKKNTGEEWDVLEFSKKPPRTLAQCGRGEKAEKPFGL